MVQIKDKRIVNPALNCSFPWSGKVLAFNILLHDFVANGLTQTFQRNIQEKRFQKFKGFSFV